MLPLEPDQIQRINQPGATWALYEIMPLDSHELFAEMDVDEKMLVGMDKQELAKYIPNQFGWPPDKYQQFLDQYYRFHREATEDDPPENKWVLVKFIKAHEIQVDSDAQQSLLEGDGRYFDTSGRAVEGRLQRGEEGTVEFEVGDTGVFDTDTADTLVTDGVCEKVKEVYRRSLHDYERFFRETFYRHIELNDSINRVTRDRDTLIANKAKADEQIAYRSEEKVKLEKDLIGFRQEKAEAANYAAALETQWQKTMEHLSQLYNTNNLLMAELTKLQYQLAQEINRRTTEATAQAAPPTAPVE
jgi:hypothetical protein